MASKDEEEPQTYCDFRLKEIEMVAERYFIEHPNNSVDQAIRWYLYKVPLPLLENDPHLTKLTRLFCLAWHHTHPIEYVCTAVGEKS